MDKIVDFCSDIKESGSNTEFTAERQEQKLKSYVDLDLSEKDTQEIIDMIRKLQLSNTSARTSQLCRYNNSISKTSCKKSKATSPSCSRYDSHNFERYYGGENLSRKPLDRFLGRDRDNLSAKFDDLTRQVAEIAEYMEKRNSKNPTDLAWKYSITLPKFIPGEHLDIDIVQKYIKLISCVCTVKNLQEYINITCKIIGDHILTMKEYKLVICSHLDYPMQTLILNSKNDQWLGLLFILGEFKYGINIKGKLNELESKRFSSTKELISEVWPLLNNLDENEHSGYDALIKILNNNMCARLKDDFEKYCVSFDSDKSIERILYFVLKNKNNMDRHFQNILRGKETKHYKNLLKAKNNDHFSQSKRYSNLCYKCKKPGHKRFQCKI